MPSYKEKYQELLKDMWNIFGYISQDMQKLQHMGSKTDSISLEMRRVIMKIVDDEEELDSNSFLTNNRKDWELTIEKYKKLWEKRNE